MPRYALLPYETEEAFDGLSASEMQAIVQRYHRWTKKIANRGKLVAGHKLADGEGRLVRGAGDAMKVTDGPFSESKEILGGLWIIEADDWDAAVELVSDCPHLEFGALSIRRVE